MLAERVNLSLADLEMIEKNIVNHSYKEMKHPDNVNLCGMVMVSHHSVIPAFANYIAREHEIALPFVTEISLAGAIYLDLAKKEYSLHR